MWKCFRRAHPKLARKCAQKSSVLKLLQHFWCPWFVLMSDFEYWEWMTASRRVESFACTTRRFNHLWNDKIKIVICLLQFTFCFERVLKNQDAVHVLTTHDSNRSSCVLHLKSLGKFWLKLSYARYHESGRKWKFYVKLAASSFIIIQQSGRRGNRGEHGFSIWSVICIKFTDCFGMNFQQI